MYLSRYALIFPWPDDPEQRLVYSTRTSAKALVPAATLADLETNSLDDESIATLTELGFLVPDMEEERREVFAMVPEINRLRTVMNVLIVVNLHCNFRCRYCYEGESKGSHFMDRQTADQVISFIKERFKPCMTRLTLDFYGGEPLLSPKIIEQIAGGLKPYIENMGAEFAITLVTNGSLLTSFMVHRLLPYGLKRAKVTLDGPPENHNFFRPYRNGRASFERIISNIKECCDLIDIGISGNFTRDNFHLFPELFEHLTANGLTPDKVYRLSFSPVLQTTAAHAGGFCGGCASSNEAWLGEAVSFLQEKIMESGYRTSNISPSLCMVDVDNSFVVHFDGGLYQCVAMIGHKEYQCGDVRRGMQDYSRQYSLNHWQNHRQCRNCAYLPLCFGGCRYMAFQRNGHMADVDCRKDFLYTTLENCISKDSLQFLEERI